MDRRTLILGALTMLSATAPPVPAEAKTRSNGRRAITRPGGGTMPAAGRQRGSLTANQVRTRIVTRTFTSRVPIAIPALAAAVAAPYPSTIQVSGLSQGRILDVRVSLNGLTHDLPSHLDVMVVAPGNAGVILMSDTGGATPITGITLTFDQDAPHRLPDTLTSGTFQPVNLADAADPFPPPAPQGMSGHSLTRFTNRNPNGRWRLFIVNDGPYFGGTLAGWSLQIRAWVRVPDRRRRPRRRARR